MNNWYVRADKDSPLMGPYDLYSADIVARELSDPRIGNLLGFAELVTLVGERGGDPVKSPSELFVVYRYIDGRKLFGGRAAEYQATKP